jgi:hypothetical protein
MAREDQRKAEERLVTLVWGGQLSYKLRGGRSGYGRAQQTVSGTPHGTLSGCHPAR